MDFFAVVFICIVCAGQVMLGIGIECIDGVCQHRDAVCEDVSNQCLCSGENYNVQTCLPTVSACNILEDDTLAVAYIEGKKQKVYSSQAAAIPFTPSSVHILSTRSTPSRDDGFKEVVLTASVSLDFDESFSGGEIVLVLACFEDILWELYVQQNGRRIDRVILLSAEDCGVRSVPESAIDRVQVLPKLSADLPFGYGNDTLFGDTPGLIRLVEDCYGPVTSFYGAFTADHWAITLKDAPMTQEPPPNNGVDTLPIPPPTSAASFPIRLVGSSQPHHGVLEVHHEGLWRYVCKTSWDDDASYVACRQLGYPGAVGFTSNEITRGTGRRGDHYLKGQRPSGRVFRGDVKCMGTERGLHQCDYGEMESQGCLSTEGVELTCARKLEEAQINIRLSCDELEVPDDDSAPYPCHVGLVEVLHNSQWTMVCDDTWETSVANAVCQQFGFKGAISAPAGGLDPNPDVTYVGLRLGGRAENRKLVASEMGCLHGVGARARCLVAMRKGKPPPEKLESEEPVKTETGTSEAFVFFFILFFLFIIVCVVVICIFYQCRSNKAKVNNLSSPFQQTPPQKSRFFSCRIDNMMQKPRLFSFKLDKVFGKPHLSKRKLDETPILEFLAMASLHTPIAQYNYVTTEESRAFPEVRM